MLGSLYMKDSDCCGCGACRNICPCRAIEMKPDECGFLYPFIDGEKCVECGLCKKVCGYQKEVQIPEIKETYAAVAENEILLKGSASGGVFAAVATEVLKRGGVVFGCYMEQENGKLVPKHIMIDKLKDLSKLQGSKYVQSFMGDCFIKAKEELAKERLVLFSGTPCQIDGLKGYLRGKTYDNLLTVDLICHGVPSSKMFQDYISDLCVKLGGQVIGFEFRDKTAGWGLNGKITYVKENKIISKSLPCSDSSYYSLFLESAIYRESCYSCKYANENRVGDFTIGDFWGIEREHPEYLKNMNIQKGISCMIVNTNHGRIMLKELCPGIKLLSSQYEKAARGNAQLNRPSVKSKKRSMILDLYKTGGYEAIEKWYKKSRGIKYCTDKMKRLIPQKWKMRIKKILKV